MNHSLSFASTRTNAATRSKVLYITECSAWGELGYETVSTAFCSVFPIFWSSGMPKPDLSGWQGDWIISFKSDLILPQSLLEQAKKGALNFHPSPPKYRGLGGYWWALHNGDSTFGVTCHHMNERIDHGDIIKTESFPVWPSETVDSLKHKSAIHSLMLLNETLNDIINEKPLMPCGVKWEEHLYTSQELVSAQSVHAVSNDFNNTNQALKALEAIQNGIVSFKDEDGHGIIADKSYGRP